MSQKFFLGDRVRIAKDLGPSMDHFEKDCEAIVMYSYAEQYDGRDVDKFSLHILPNRGESSWYYADQLTLIEPNRLDLLPKNNIHRKNSEAKQARDRDLPGWLIQGRKDQELLERVERLANEA
jgi:hypothetical protein